MLLILACLATYCIHTIDSYRFSSHQPTPKFSVYGDKRICNSRLSLQTVSEDLKTESESVELLSIKSNVSTLKVPANAWRWPPVWPFPPDFLEPVDNSSASVIIENVVAPTFSKFLSHLHEEETSSSTLIVAPKSFALVQSIELQSYVGLSEFSFVATEEVSIIETIDHEDEKFDRVAVLAGVESLARPKEVFRDIWRVLRPGGVCVTYFNGEPHLLPEGPPPVKMWTTMNDEQKIWIAGSYFHYSAPGGWENILGFDLAGVTGADQMKFDLARANGSRTAYAVQATKLAFPSPPLLQEPAVEEAHMANLSAYLETRLLGVRGLEKPDRQFLALRLAREFGGGLPSPAQLADRLQRLGRLYRVLAEVKEAVIPPPVKAMVGAFLSPQWAGSQKEERALRMAVGLLPPDEGLWKPLSGLTASMGPKEKIHLLLDLVPMVARDEPSLALLPDLLARLLAGLKTRFPEVSEGKLQAFAVDLAVSDFLRAGQSPDRILRFVETYPLEGLGEVMAESLRQLDLQQ